MRCRRPATLDVCLETQQRGVGAHSFVDGEQSQVGKWSRTKMTRINNPIEPEPTVARGVGRAIRVLIAGVLAIVLGYIGYLAIALGPHLAELDWEALLRGHQRILQPAELRGAPLRAVWSGVDRVYLLTTQSERVVPLRLGRVSAMRARQFLHVDLWAFDAGTARVAWRRRVRSFEDDEPMTYELLGAAGATLWLFVREPIGVALRDGSLVADGARIDEANSTLAGKRVDQLGYVAFGAQGLQLTLSDSTQWIIDEELLIAQPRASAPRHADDVIVPAYGSSDTSRFQLRGLPLTGRWLGVLTDEEAATLKAPPVVPGSKPGERRPAMEDVYERQHVPGDLTVRPVRYRLWSARVAKVSAAPSGWPKGLPDNWGTRDKFSDYAALPDAPVFLQAGLLGDGRSPIPYWLREPDSVLVLHHDKVGDAGRLRLARVAGPGGRVVWDAPLTLADLQFSTLSGDTLFLIGSVPNPNHDRTSEVSRQEHQVLVSVAVASGAIARYDLTAASVVESEPAPTSIATDDRVERQ